MSTIPRCSRGFSNVLRNLAADLPLLLPAHPRLATMLEGLDLGSIRVVEPQGYLDFVALEMAARVVLTDSGGVQEETTILGVPCLTLRESTERPVTVTDGTNTIVGRDPARIAAGFASALSGPTSPRRPALWDGAAGGRIAEVLVNADPNRLRPTGSSTPIDTILRRGYRSRERSMGEQAMSKSHALVRVVRLVGAVFVTVGLGVLVWTFVVWQWNDPFTSLYTRWQQHELTAAHQDLVKEFRPLAPPAVQVSPAEQAAVVERDATRFRKMAAVGAPIGRIIAPQLGLNMLFVNGTGHEELKKGPGRDKRTYMPGQGQLVYIAGHRTTYGAPLAHIDRLKSGDRITLEMPYASFSYVVTGHQIVDDQDLSVLRSRGKEIVALQACHPRFFATERYIVWAKPVSVTPTGGVAYRPIAN